MILNRNKYFEIHAVFSLVFMFVHFFISESKIHLSVARTPSERVWNYLIRKCLHVSKKLGILQVIIEKYMEVFILPCLTPWVFLLIQKFEVKTSVFGKSNFEGAQVQFRP